jgi:glycosyltransferase involved in cell wall biosynthesis
MRIGIDARFLSNPQRGGFKTYTNSVIFALAEVDQKNEYLLYTDRPLDCTIGLPANFVLRPVSGLNALSREQFTLPSLMRRDKVDLAHFLCNTAPVIFHPRMVVTIHDAIAMRSRAKEAGSLGLKQRLLAEYWRLVIPKCAKKAEMIITVSEFARDDLVSTLGLKNDDFRIVRNGIDPVFNNSASGTRPSEIQPDTDYVLAFASADGRKNHPASIAAFREVRREFPGLKLVLVCSHPSVRESLRQCEDGVLPVGPVSLDELVWLYRNGLALVFPSLDEGFGLPPVEAAACGMPVVASDSGSLPEILGDAAVLVSLSDEDGLASGVRSILENHSLRSGLVARGLDRAKRYTRLRVGKELLDVYGEAVA